MRPTAIFLLLTRSSLERLSMRYLALRSQALEPSSSGILAFDKDDVDTLDFVASAANLRSHIFNIAAKSKFDIKRKPLCVPSITHD